MHVSSPVHQSLRIAPAMHNPHLTEELWTLVGQHIMDVKEWARMSGTCKASWRTRYAGKLAVSQDMPVEGATLDAQHDAVRTPITLVYMSSNAVPWPLMKVHVHVFLGSLKTRGTAARHAIPVQLGASS